MAEQNQFYLAILKIDWSFKLNVVCEGQGKYYGSLGYTPTSAPRRFYFISLHLNFFGT